VFQPILKFTVVRPICNHFSADVDGVSKSRFSLRQTAESPHPPGANLRSVAGWRNKEFLVGFSNQG
jgi:hypothetical protein